MAITKKYLGINVLEAAEVRIKNIFASGLKVYLDVSGGKDSIVMMSLVYDLINQGEIDASHLEVVFIDEEVIYDDVIRVCKEWRKKFMLVGARYRWYTIEHRNNNCFNALENNENFIPWDRYEEKNWSHKKPDFAESESPFLVPRTENYQDFLSRSQKDGVTIIGVRAAESHNRLQYLATVNAQGGMTKANIMYPIYDWKDQDIWKYIKDKNLDFPDVYLRMYEAGVQKDRLRVCNLFSIDTCASLVNMFEVYPDLWESVIKREPNAYLVRLYWDSEMFHRQTRTRKKLEGDNAGEGKDYRAMLVDVLNNPKKYFKNKHAIELCRSYRTMYIKNADIMTDDQCRKCYNALLAGDTKGRTLRALRTNIYGDYLKRQGEKEHWVNK